MELEDLEPKHKKPTLKNLDELSIEALGEYIEELETEITRVRAKIKEKEQARDTAAGFFKT